MKTVFYKYPEDIGSEDDQQEIEEKAQKKISGYFQDPVERRRFFD